MTPEYMNGFGVCKRGGKKMKEQSRLQLVLPKELKEKVHKKAKENGLSMSTYIRVVLIEKLRSDVDGGGLTNEVTTLFLEEQVISKRSREVKKMIESLYMRFFEEAESRDYDLFWGLKSVYGFYSSDCIEFVEEWLKNKGL